MVNIYFTYIKSSCLTQNQKKRMNHPNWSRQNDDLAHNKLRPYIILKKTHFLSLFFYRARADHVWSRVQEGRKMHYKLMRSVPSETCYALYIWRSCVCKWWPAKTRMSIYLSSVPILSRLSCSSLQRTLKH